MNDVSVLHGEERGDGGLAGQLVGREAESDHIREFQARARTDDGAVLTSGEPGVGKTELLDAASEEVAAPGTRVSRAARVGFRPSVPTGFDAVRDPHPAGGEATDEDRPGSSPS